MVTFVRTFPQWTPWAGDADCHASSPQSPPCRRPKVRHAQLRPKARAGQRSLGAPLPTKGAPLRGPVVMPAKGQSRATLPWGSSPRKGCPFAGPPALVRNDMQKTETRLRVQRRFSGSTPAVPWFYADARQVSACHCEERSDVAIRTPCGSAWRKVVLWANTQLLRICRKWYHLAKFPCGVTDCHTSVRTGSQ